MGRTRKEKWGMQKIKVKMLHRIKGELNINQLKLWVKLNEVRYTFKLQLELQWFFQGQGKVIPCGLVYLHQV